MNRFLAAVVLAVSAPAAGLEAVELRYEDIPLLVAEKNGAVTGEDRLAEAARARTGHLGRSYLPSVEAEAGGERFTTASRRAETEVFGHLEAKVNLYRGGRDGLEDEARERSAERAAAESRAARAERLTRARKTFWRLVSERETASLIEKALSDNETLLATAQRRISRGLATETDRLEFEINRSLLREELESLQHAATLTEMTLAANLGLAAGTRLRTAETISHEHDESWLAAPFAAAEHPEAAALRAQERGLELDRRRARRWWTPSLDLYGGLYQYTFRERDYTRTSERDDRAVGARLTLPLFDGRRSGAEAQSLRLQVEGATRRREQAELALAAATAVAKEDLRHDHELVHFAEERIEQGRRYLARTLEEYERGVKNSLDALGAAKQDLGFRRQYAERRRDYQYTKAALLSFLER